MDCLLYWPIYCLPNLGTKQQNSRKFSPAKVSCYVVVGIKSHDYHMMVFFFFCRSHSPYISSVYELSDLSVTRSM